MASQYEDDEQALSVSEGFRRSGVSFEQAWVEYLTMGGSCSRGQVFAALRGQETLDDHEHNRLAAALNEYFVEAGHDHPVETHEHNEPG